MGDQDTILLHKDADGVATITLNRPDKYNAFTFDMITAWVNALDDCAADAAVRVMVLTGAGKAFCSGGDVGSQKERLESDALARKNYLYRHVHKVPLAMERLDKPVLCAINGPARGAGMDMALMCDIRLMADTATLAESYINVGLIAGDGGAWYLPRLIGSSKALELLWTGRVVDAAEAERMGLASHVTTADNLMPKTLELARAIAAQPFEAVRAMKRTVYQGAALSLAAHLDMVSSHMSVLRDTDDHRQRVNAFMERKRKDK